MLQIDIFLVEVIKSMCLVSRFYWYLFIFFFLMENKNHYNVAISHFKNKNIFSDYFINIERKY